MPSHIAIGDIHGLPDVLQRLLNKLPPCEETIFLGDYIDRGPDSKSVVDLLRQYARDHKCIFLRGNHEQMLLDAQSGDEKANMHWIYNGGSDTMACYGEAIQPDHLIFFAQTQGFHETDDYIFVHAGLQPGKSAADTSPYDRCWIREPFLSTSFDWGKRVVHGHTPTRHYYPEMLPNRINIDTGAVYGGRLSAVLLPERKFLWVWG